MTQLTMIRPTDILLPLFLTATNVNADFAAMEALFNRKLESYNQENQNLSRNNHNLTLTRGLIGGNGIISTSLEHISGYGCWCYFGWEHGKGKGEPANGLDQYCKYLHDGYECAIMDSKLGGDDNCVPWEVEYNPALTLGNEFEQLEYECLNKNGGDNCATRACAIEHYFITNIFAAFFDPTHFFDPSLKHALGQFDPVDHCPVIHGHVQSEKSCCGNYPRRYPFKTLSGERGCCGKRTYDTFRFQCCDEDGSVVDSTC